MSPEQSGHRSLTEPTPGERRTHWLIVEGRNLANPLLAALASFLITIWTTHGVNDLWTWPALWWLFVALVTIGFWALCYFKLLRPRYSELAQSLAGAEAEIEGAQNALQSVLEAALAQLMIDRSFANAESRISAYSVEHDRFVLLARHSVNPVLERRGRATYPLDKGVIGKAWAAGSATRTDDVETREEWEELLVENGEFTAEEAAGLTMWARSICAVRVDLGPTHKLGMIVVESEVKNAFVDGTAKTLRSRPIYSAVADIIQWHEHFPRAKEWHEERLNGQATKRLQEPAWKSAQAS